MSKPIEELTIMNDFLFGVVMRQEKYCKPLLEYILNIKIKKLEYKNNQETFQAPIPSAKSIRLDVYAEDDTGSVYDLEVQTTNKRNLGKRARYYQSMIDIRIIEQGNDYRTLKKSFIIFICNYDPFGLSEYIYTFRSRCDEVSDLVLDDDAVKIVINTKGIKGNISDELKAIINYMGNGIMSNEYTKALNAEVESIKSDEKVRSQYMLLAEAFSWQKDLGEFRRVVRVIRKKYTKLSIAEMADLFDIPETDCEKVVKVITAHPEKSDEEIAEELDWTTDW